jgi:molybdopterin synthase catalytic subunit
MPDSVCLVQGPLSRELAIPVEARWSRETRVGAQTWFVGQIRADALPEGQVSAIEYTAENILAEAVLSDIRNRAMTEYGCIDVWIRHSLGLVPSGGISFMVGIASVHRKAAFDALRMVVDSVKAEAPIYGRELGNSGYRWKVNQS